MKRVFLSALLGFCFCYPVTAQQMPWIQFDNQEAMIYSELQLRNPAKFSSFSSYPYSWKEFLSEEKSIEKFSVWQKFLFEKYRSFTVSDSANLTISNAGILTASKTPLSTKTVRMTDYTILSGQINPYLTFSTSLQMDTDASLDSDYKGRIRNDVNNNPIQGFLIHKHAYLLGGSGGFEAMFGKQKISWGPTLTHSLIISESAPAFDLLWFRYTWNFIRLTHFWSQLDHNLYEKQSVLTTDAELVRHLLGTRLEFRISDSWSAGISQTILFATEGFGFKLSYLNPLTSYFGERQNTGITQLDDNISYHADLTYRDQGIFGFGNILIDDFSLDGTVGNKLGFQIGGEISDPVLPFQSTVSVQLTTIAPKTYTVKANNGPVWLNYVVYSKMIDYDQKDLSKGSIIGNPLGPDSWQVFLRHRLWNFYPVWFETSIVLENLGVENNLLPIPIGSNSFKDKYDFDETHTRIKFSFNYDYESSAKLSSFLIYSDIRNPNHQSGKSQDFNVGITAQFDVYTILHLKRTLFNF